jgi:heat shock protein HslJ
MMRSALLALLLLGACAQTPAPPSETPAAIVHLSGTKWRRVDDLNANPHGATLEFDGARASGYTGCNNWFGAVTQNGEELRFSGVGATERACLADVQMATERNFLGVLERARYAHYDQYALVLLDEQQNQIARFESMSP